MRRSVFAERRAHVLAGTTPSERQTRCVRFPEIGVPNLVLSNDAKETVLFVGDSGGEEDSGILREEIPQAVKLERRSIGAHEPLEEIARHRIVIVDLSVTEIADPKLVFNQRESPRRAALTAP